jgi:hypothetical protein
MLTSLIFSRTPSKINTNSKIRPHKPGSNCSFFVNDIKQGWPGRWKTGFPVKLGRGKNILKLVVTDGHNTVTKEMTIYVKE